MRTYVPTCKRLFFGLDASASRKERRNEVYLFVSVHFRWKNFQWKRNVPTANRYAAVCRLDRFEKRVAIRASTYAAPREAARRGAKVRGDVSPRKVTTIPRPEIALQSNSHGKTAAHGPVFRYMVRWSVGGPVGDVSLLFACYSLRPRVLFARGDQSYWYTTLRYYIM